MTIGNINIDKNQIMNQYRADYPTRQYQFMQDTLNNALMNQQQLQMMAQPNGVQTQMSSPNQSSQWGQ